MKSVSSGLGKDLNEYAKRAMDAVFNSFANGVGNFAYKSAMKTPLVTRSEIFYGGADKDNIGVHSFPSFEEKVESKFSGKLEKRSEKIIGRLDEALEAGKINEAQYKQTFFSEMKNLHEEFRTRNDVYKKNFLPFAEYDMLNGVPQSMVVPESHRNLGGLSAGMWEDNAAEGRIIPAKPTPHKIEHRNETFVEKQIYKAMNVLSGAGKEAYKGVDWVIGGFLNDLEWVAKQMSKHPIIVGAVTVTGVVGLGAAADYKLNEGKTMKSIGDYSKSAGSKIMGGVSGVFGGFGDLFKGNQPPVADFEIKGNLTEGPISSVDIIIDKSYDPDGKIVKHELRVDGLVTPTPIQTLSQGKHAISLTVYDNEGKSASKSEIVEVKPHVFTPYLKVYGSPEYVKKVQDALDNLKKTPDSFRINGKTAYEYVTFYLDALYEGAEGGKLVIDGKEYYGGRTGYPVGVDALPIDRIGADILVHITRHKEQVLLNIGRDVNGSNCVGELDAIKIGVDWSAARGNWSEETKEEMIKRLINQYTDWKTGQKCSYP